MLTAHVLCDIMQVLSKNTLHTGGEMDLATKVEISALFEVYGNSLTDKQKQVVDFCVLQDLSLGEVSDLLNISRQAVKYTLDNAILSMLKLEEELKILDKFQDIKHKLTKLLESTNDTKLRQQINKILEEL